MNMDPLNYRAGYAAADFCQTCCSLIKLASLLPLVDRFQQVGKINNLEQICGVFGCVEYVTITYLILSVGAP